MRILVDANIFTRSQKTGVDYYAEGLIWAAARRMPNDTFVLAYFGKGHINIPQGLSNIKVKRIWWLPTKMYGVYRHYVSFLPFDLFVPVKSDIMFFPDFGCPRTIQKVPKLVIIHDLVYALQPEYVVPNHRKFLSALTKQALINCTKVIVNSESTKRDLLKVHKTNKPIVTIAPAVDADFYTPASSEQINQIKAKYGISGDYTLFLSTLEPRKNVASLIKAYSALSSEVRSKYKLVLAGKKGWLDDEIQELCETMGDHVIRTGRVETIDKPALYSGASVFAFPSAYEGFGMPILEAMACGTPVITSNVSSMPEVAGDAAVIVNPKDTHEISEALTKVLSDKTIANKFIGRGLKRSRKFTWDASGEKMADTLKQLVKTDIL